MVANDIFLYLQNPLLFESKQSMQALLQFLGYSGA